MDDTGLPLNLDLGPYLRPEGGKSSAVRCSSPDQTKYHDPMIQGVAARNGMRGVVIPRARPDGTSKGFDHGRPAVLVVDPGDDGRGLEVDLSKIGSRRAGAIYRAACGAVDANPDSEGLEPIQRVRAITAAFFQVAALDPEGQGRAAVVPAPPAIPVPAAEEPPPTMTTGFLLPPDAYHAGLPASRPGVLSAAFDTPAPPAPAPVAPDDLRTVTFGIGGEDIPSQFTVAIRVGGERTGALILGAPAGRGVFFPKSVQPFAAHVAGEATVLRLEATGICYVHRGEDIAVYLVIDERPI